MPIGSSSARTASSSASMPARFGRGETIYDPWHYVPVLARKPGALRNGAPFQDWVLPSAMERVRRRLKAVDDGDRQMVAILGCVLTDGLDAVEAACQEALDQGVCSAAVIINILARRRDPAPAVTILTPDALRLAHEPHGRLRPLRQPQEGKLMERTQVLELMGTLKLYGMRSAYDEVMAHRHQAPARAAADRRRSAAGRDRREAGPLDQIPAHRRQAAAGQGHRGVRLRRHAGQRERWSATSPTAPSSPTSATSCSSAAPEPASRIWPSPSPVP